MAFRPSKIKRHKKDYSQQAKLSLTSMMDIFIVILLFLLKSYSATEAIVTTDESFRLPLSSSEMEAQPALVLKVNQEVLVLGDQLIANTPVVFSQEELLINPLYLALKEEAKKSKFIANQNESVSFRGELIIQGDQQIPYSLIKKIMYTSSQAEFGNISLAVIQKGA